MNILKSLLKYIPQSYLDFLTTKTKLIIVYTTIILISIAFILIAKDKNYSLLVDLLKVLQTILPAILEVTL